MFQPVHSPDIGLANKLHALNITLWHKDACRSFPAYQTYDKDLLDVVVCIRDLETHNKIPCRGDSGGPIVFDDELVGVLSGSITEEEYDKQVHEDVACNDPTTVGVYNSVVHQRGWIEELLSSSPPPLPPTPVIPQSPVIPHSQIIPQTPVIPPSPVLPPDPLPLYSADKITEIPQRRRTPINSHRF